MSDTPRTDTKRSGSTHFMGDWVDANFAAQLERELNAANVEIERLTAKVAQLYAGAEEQNQRIKQLDDRIHRAASAFFRDGSDGHVASQMLAILEEERGKP